MKTFTLKYCSLLLAFFMGADICLQGKSNTPFVLDKLVVEYREHPMGIDEAQPRFGWQMIAKNTKRGQRQTAYQISVTDEQGTEVWNSGKVISASSLNIPYGGQALQPETRYQWTVDVWDQNKKSQRSTSTFETGLMPGSDVYLPWDQAQWIGGPSTDKSYYAPYLPVFQIEYDVQLEEASMSNRASLIFGANDPRLLSPYMNLQGLSNPRNGSYIEVELDLRPLTSGQCGKIVFYRVGYAPSDTDKLPFKSIEIPLSALNKANQYNRHSLKIACNLGNTEVWFNQQPLKGSRFNLNPIGHGGDYIAYPVLGDIGYKLRAHQRASFSKIVLRNYRSPSNIIATKELPIRPSDTDDVCFIDTTTMECGAPMLRTTFSVQEHKRLAKARLYITARGIYDAYINGQRISHSYFNPGLTQYNRTHLYQTFDVTDILTAGGNAIGIQLSEGWWSGGVTYAGENWNYYGDQQAVLAKLSLVYADGSKEFITTNPNHWLYTSAGPVRYGSFFQGEVYDATREPQFEGWSCVSYQPSPQLWSKAEVVHAEECVSQQSSVNNPSVADYSQFSLVGQSDGAITSPLTLTARQMEEVRPGLYVYDLGQNMAGVPLITLHGLQPGTPVTLRYAEVKYPDREEYASHRGMLMLENIRAAMAQDRYIARGGKETIAPRYTYHGFRYIEISGIDHALPLTDVKATVLSSIDTLCSSYTTSNPLVNQLWKNITWSARANFMSIPTDCPQRNERLGWSGDISVFSRTATYVASLPCFLRRHLTAMRDVQRADGRFPDVAPLGGGFGGILWGSAGITVAWESYQQYADRRMLQEHYPSMKQYIDYIQNVCIDSLSKLIVQEKVWGNLADWLGPEDNLNDKSLLWECYYIYDLELMQKVALVLGFDEDARYYAGQASARKRLFVENYIDSAHSRTISAGVDGPARGTNVDTQTSYVLPLVFQLGNDSLSTSLGSRLREILASPNGNYAPYSLLTGFIGTAWISQALSNIGATADAYRLLQQTAYPSWLYSVEQGATTIWERLNSYTHENGFGGNNHMNSFNHYSFGSVGAWMYNYSLGIARDETQPGFQHFILRPEPDPTGQMTSAKGHYDSMYGRIESGWRTIGETTYYDFHIPANTSATLYLAASSLQNISEGGHPAKRTHDIKYIGENNGKYSFNLPSGTYNFAVHK